LSSANSIFSSLPTLFLRLFFNSKAISSELYRMNRLAFPPMSPFAQYQRCYGAYPLIVTI